MNLEQYIINALNTYDNEWFLEIEKEFKSNSSYDPKKRVRIEEVKWIEEIPTEFDEYDRPIEYSSTPNFREIETDLFWYCFNGSTKSDSRVPDLSTALNNIQNRLNDNLLHLSDSNSKLQIIQSVKTIISNQIKLISKNTNGIYKNLFVRFEYLFRLQNEGLIDDLKWSMQKISDTNKEIKATIKKNSDLVIKQEIIETKNLKRLKKADFDSILRLTDLQNRSLIDRDDIQKFDDYVEFFYSKYMGYIPKKKLIINLCWKKNASYYLLKKILGTNTVLVRNDLIPFITILGCSYKPGNASKGAYDFSNKESNKEFRDSIDIFFK